MALYLNNEQALQFIQEQFNATPDNEKQTAMRILRATAVKQKWNDAISWLDQEEARASERMKRQEQWVTWANTVFSPDHTSFTPGEDSIAVLVSFKNNIVNINIDEYILTFDMYQHIEI